MEDSGIKQAYKVMLKIAIEIIASRKNDDQRLKYTNKHSKHIRLLRKKGGKY